MELSGRTVLVTGGAVRIGRAIVRAVAARGAAVVIHYRGSLAEAEALVREIESDGGRAASVAADLQQPEAVRELARAAAAPFGAVDVLVNNAAIFPRVPFAEVTEAEWDRTLATNLKAPFFLAQSLAPAMIARGAGKIVNLADVAAFRPWPNYLPYSLSKAGIVAFTQGLARALAPAVQVNAIAPGAILFPEEWSEQKRQSLLAQVPLGRPGDPEDIARTVLYLIEGSDYVTGAVIPVDGGRLLD